VKNYGVIGYPIKQSFSPSYFAKKFRDLGLTEYSYDAYALKSTKNLKQFIDKNKLNGLNVTMPLKQSVIPQLDRISTMASEINAVNTVLSKKGNLYGYNTDISGFRKSLLPCLSRHQKSALIFGTGGSSLAIKFVLRGLGIPYNVVSRSPGVEFTYGDLDADIISEHKLLINTTPLGMKHRMNESVDIPYAGIGNEHLCYDLIYSPEKTKFLSIAEEQGSKIKNGLEMLKIQAEKSWEIWNS